MKKVLLTISTIVSLSTIAICQKPTGENPYSIEGQLSLNSTSMTFNSPSIRARYFLKDNLAVRASISLDNSSEKNNYYELPNNEGQIGYEINKIIDNSISVGVEKHLQGTSKLSPYFGADFIFGFGNETAKWNNFDGTGFLSDFTAKAKNPTSSIGLNLIAGTDYYFAENFYLGFELGVGFNVKSTKAGSLEYSTGGITTNSLSEPSSGNEFGNNFIGNIRIGWRF
jgi:outer membrane protein W